MPRSGSIKLQIASAYLVTASRMGSWLVVSALLYRYYGAAAFATLALVRGVVGILNYATVGIGPAVIHLATKKRTSDAPIPVEADISSSEISTSRVLNYESKRAPIASFIAKQAFGAGVYLSLLLLICAPFLVTLLTPVMARCLRLDPFADTASLIRWYAAGTLLRLCSDASGTSLQVVGRIARDNVFLSLAELAWMILYACSLCHGNAYSVLEPVGVSYCLSGAMLLVLRIFSADHYVGRLPAVTRIPPQVFVDLLTFGSIVMIAQLADYLYAPTDYLLINHLIDASTVAVYAPAVQIDAALLLLVTGLSAVILPRSALAHAEGNAAAVRQYYVRGTLASLVLLAGGALVAWLVAPLAFKAWLGNSLPSTRLILPLVLIHTVIGGSSSVGRAILLGIGKARAFAAAALIAGAVNVVLSYCFVVYCGLGLKGIILGTIVAVVGRCGIWMPWYVTRQLRQPAELKWEEPELIG